MVEVRLLRGSARLVETDDSNYYEWKGERFYRVTSILRGGIPSHALTNWKIGNVATAAADLATDGLLEKLVQRDYDAAVKMLRAKSEAETDRAAKLGTTVHDAAEAYALGRPIPECAPNVQPFLNAFGTWIYDFQPTFFAVEAPVFSISERYAGTLDAIVDIEPYGRLLVDYKTGKGVYAEVALQLAAYRYGEGFIGLPDGSEEPVPEVDGCAVVHLRPEGYKFIPVQADKLAFDYLRYAREVFRWSRDGWKGRIGTPIKPGAPAWSVGL